MKQIEFKFMEYSWDMNGATHMNNAPSSHKTP